MIDGTHVVHQAAALLGAGYHADFRKFLERYGS